jgi:hypothetical protein
MTIVAADTGSANAGKTTRAKARATARDDIVVSPLQIDGSRGGDVRAVGRERLADRPEDGSVGSASGSYDARVSA